jgi:hypothetical protein
MALAELSAGEEGTYGTPGYCPPHLQRDFDRGIPVAPCSDCYGRDMLLLELLCFDPDAGFSTDEAPAEWDRDQLRGRFRKRDLGGHLLAESHNLDHLDPATVFDLVEDERPRTLDLPRPHQTMTGRVPGSFVRRHSALPVPVPQQLPSRSWWAERKVLYAGAAVALLVVLGLFLLVRLLTSNRGHPAETVPASDTTADGKKGAAEEQEKKEDTRPKSGTRGVLLLVIQTRLVTQSQHELAQELREVRKAHASQLIDGSVFVVNRAGRSTWDLSSPLLEEQAIANDDIKLAMDKARVAMSALQDRLRKEDRKPAVLLVWGNDVDPTTVPGLTKEDVRMPRPVALFWIGYAAESRWMIEALGKGAVVCRLDRDIQNLSNVYLPEYFSPQGGNVP